MASESSVKTNSSVCPNNQTDEQTGSQLFKQPGIRQVYGTLFTGRTVISPNLVTTDLFPFSSVLGKFLKIALSSIILDV